MWRWVRNMKFQFKMPDWRSFLSLQLHLKKYPASGLSCTPPRLPIETGRWLHVEGELWRWDHPGGHQSQLPPADSSPSVWCWWGWSPPVSVLLSHCYVWIMYSSKTASGDMVGDCQGWLVPLGSPWLALEVTSGNSFVMKD